MRVVRRSPGSRFAQRYGVLLVLLEVRVVHKALLYYTEPRPQGTLISNELGQVSVVKHYVTCSYKAEFRSTLFALLKLLHYAVVTNQHLQYLVSN